MELFYLKNKLAGKTCQQHKYYDGCGDMETDAGTNELSGAQFYATSEMAAADIKSANDWYEKHDYEVKSITLEELIAQCDGKLNLRLLLPKNEKKKPSVVKDEPTRQITFIIEGTDGVGKSTVIEALKKKYCDGKTITEYPQTDTNPVKLSFNFLDRETTTISASMLFTVRMKDRVERIKKYLNDNPDTFIIFLVNEDAEELLRRIETRDKPISEFDRLAPSYNLMYMATFREMQIMGCVNYQIAMLDITGEDKETEAESTINAVKSMLVNRAMAKMSLIQF